MWKKVLSIAGAIVLLATLTGGAIKFNDTFAKAESVRQNSLQIQIDRYKDDIRWYQDQMRYLMNQYQAKKCEDLPYEAWQSYEHYRVEKERLDTELRNLIKAR